MGGPIKTSLRQRVLSWVLEHGPCTIAQVLAGVGRHIPVAQALAAGRTQERSQHNRQRRGKQRGSPDKPWTRAQLLQWGRRYKMTETLSRLSKEDKLSSPSKGVYGPPLPKLFKPAESA